MIHEATQLKLQAYLDGELTGSAARGVAEWLDQDAEAQGLCAELQRTKALLAAGELERPVPQSCEFYWAGVRREILAPDAPDAPANPPARPSRFIGWLKFVAPAGALALLAALALLVHPGRSLPPTSTTPMTQASPTTLSMPEEIETPMAQASFISFRSEADRMSVVWVNTR
jgi:anti-sigma factor RsiW